MDEIGKKQNVSFNELKTKANLRSHFKSLLSKVSAEDRRLFSYDLKKRLEAFLYEHAKPTYWATYKPLATEVNPEANISYITWAYPRVAGEEMHFYSPTQGEGFETNSWGILEPDPLHSQEIKKEELEGVLVPALAFSRDGHRLGRGKGYYDKFLQDFKGIKVGLAFDLQVQDELPFESHDVTMDYVITNMDTINCEVLDG